MTARLTDRERAYRAVTERDWQQQVLDVLRLHGWKCYHPWRSDHSEAGWPDVLALRGPRVIAIELKRETGRVTPEQWGWLDAWAETGAWARVLRPSDVDLLIEITR